MELTEPVIESRDLADFDARMQAAIARRSRDWQWPEWRNFRSGVSDKPYTVDLWLADNLEPRWIQDLEEILARSDV